MMPFFALFAAVVPKESAWFKCLMLSIRNGNTSASAKTILIVLVLARAIATF